jgi:hypothetical protein
MAPIFHVQYGTTIEIRTFEIRIQTNPSQPEKKCGIIVEIWTHTKRCATPQVMNRQAAILVSKLGDAAHARRPVNIFPLVTHCALDIICETAMGRSIDAQAGFRIRIRIRICINLVAGSGPAFKLRIRIQEGKNDPQK